VQSVQSVVSNADFRIIREIRAIRGFNGGIQLYPRKRNGTADGR
jgi:hypothetical protein